MNPDSLKLYDLMLYADVDENDLESCFMISNIFIFYNPNYDSLPCLVILNRLF